MTTRRHFFSLAAGLAAAVPALAQYGPRWEYLGEANVDGANDRDRIAVGRDHGQFRAIRLRVERATIRFDRVVIEFGNGERHEIRIASEIPPGRETRVIEFPRGRRYIEAVHFWYGRGSWSGARPKVRLFGQH